MLQEVFFFVEQVKKHIGLFLDGALAEQEPYTEHTIQGEHAVFKVIRQIILEEVDDVRIIVPKPLLIPTLLQGLLRQRVSQLVDLEFTLANMPHPLKVVLDASIPKRQQYEYDVFFLRAPTALIEHFADNV